jgi:hypothetical protein
MEEVGRLLAWFVAASGALILVATVVTEVDRHRRGIATSTRHFAVDWAFVVAYLCISLRVLYSQGMIGGGRIFGDILCFWPFPFVYWFNNLRYSIFLTYKPTQRNRS